MPDVGAIIKSIEVSLGFEKDPIIVGKPFGFAFDLILDSEFPEEEVSHKSFLMFGDNLNTDIKFGKNVGIDTALVLSGVTSLQSQEVLN